MKFLIDENITPDAVEIFRQHELEAWHINELKSNQKQRIVDDQLRRLAIQKNFIIVTKDDDFVHSYVHRKVPEKLIFIYGLDQKDQLLKCLKDLIPNLSKLINHHDFIEVNAHEVKFPFSD